MNILITSNFKKYYKTYIDFVDHYWINYFEKKNYVFYQLPNSKKISEKILRISRDEKLRKKIAKNGKKKYMK